MACVSPGPIRAQPDALDQAEAEPGSAA